jgi:hypothetical protein
MIPHEEKSDFFSDVVLPEMISRVIEKVSKKGKVAQEAGNLHSFRRNALLNN